MANKDEEIVLEWKQVGGRWIALMQPGRGDGHGWYEVSDEFGDGYWVCARMFRREDGGEGREAMIETGTFEQAKRIAERHWEKGIWAPDEELSKSAAELRLRERRAALQDKLFNAVACCIYYRSDAESRASDGDIGNVKDALHRLAKMCGYNGLQKYTVASDDLQEITSLLIAHAEWMRRRQKQEQA